MRFLLGVVTGIVSVLTCTSIAYMKQNPDDPQVKRIHADMAEIRHAWKTCRYKSLAAWRRGKTNDAFHKMVAEYDAE